MTESIAFAALEPLIKLGAATPTQEDWQQAALPLQTRAEVPA